MPALDAGVIDRANRIGSGTGGAASLRRCATRRNMTDGTREHVRTQSADSEGLNRLCPSPKIKGERMRCPNIIRTQQTKTNLF